MINSIIGKYKISRLIGEGGMASVYEAEHELLGTKVAIKVLNPNLSSNAQIRERFINEAKLMASLNHPNITRVIDFDNQSEQLSIIMDLLTGEDLNERIKRKGALSEEEVTSVFIQTLAAFQYAHDKGIVHRDIKPSNIYILSDGTVKILDFGIAKLFGQSNEMTQTGTQMGTPIYMSPEQVRADKTIDHRSDIYSLGVTLYYALNGKPPYDSNTTSQFDIFNKIVYEPLPVSGMDTRWNAMIQKACVKDREQRFVSCQDWLDSFQTKEGSETIATSSVPSSDQTIVEIPVSDHTILETLHSKTSDKLVNEDVPFSNGEMLVESSAKSGSQTIEEDNPSQSVKNMNLLIALKGLKLTMAFGFLLDIFACWNYHSYYYGDNQESQFIYSLTFSFVIVSFLIESWFLIRKVSLRHSLYLISTLIVLGAWNFVRYISGGEIVFGKVFIFWIGLVIISMVLDFIQLRKMQSLKRVIIIFVISFILSMVLGMFHISALPTFFDPNPFFGWNYLTWQP
jgi:serine/threonine protein kinase